MPANHPVNRDRLPAAIVAAGMLAAAGLAAGGRPESPAPDMRRLSVLLPGGCAEGGGVGDGPSLAPAGQEAVPATKVERRADGDEDLATDIATTVGAIGLAAAAPASPDLVTLTKARHDDEAATAIETVRRGRRSA